MNRKSPTAILDLSSPEPARKRRKLTPSSQPKPRSDSRSSSAGPFSRCPVTPGPLRAHDSGTTRAAPVATELARRNATVSQAPNSSAFIEMPSPLPYRKTRAPDTPSPSLSSASRSRDASMSRELPRSVSSSTSSTSSRTQVLQCFPPRASGPSAFTSPLSSSSSVAAGARSHKSSSSLSSSSFASEASRLTSSSKSFVQTRLPFSQRSPPRTVSGTRLPHPNSKAKSKSFSRTCSPAKATSRVALPHPSNEVKTSPISQRLPAKPMSRDRPTHHSQSKPKLFSQTRLVTVARPQEPPRCLPVPNGTQRRPVDLMSPVKQSTAITAPGAGKPPMANTSVARGAPGAPPLAKPLVAARKTLVNGELPVKKRRVGPPSLQSTRSATPTRIHPFFKQKFSKPVSRSSSDSAKPVPSIAPGANLYSSSAPMDPAKHAATSIGAKGASASSTSSTASSSSSSKSPLCGPSSSASVGKSPIANTHSAASRSNVPGGQLQRSGSHMTPIRTEGKPVPKPPRGDSEARVKPRHGPVQPLHGPVKPRHGPIKPHNGPVKPYHGPVKPRHGPVKPRHGPVKPHHGPVYMRQSNRFTGRQQQRRDNDACHVGGSKLCSARSVSVSVTFLAAC